MNKDGYKRQKVESVKIQPYYLFGA